jgi:hypothetical protein
MEKKNVSREVLKKKITLTDFHYEEHKILGMTLACTVCEDSLRFTAFLSNRAVLELAKNPNVSIRIATVVSSSEIVRIVYLPVEEEELIEIAKKNGCPYISPYKLR